MTAQNRESDPKFEIVIAEDSPTQAQQLSYLLEESGFRVTVGRNGQEAFNAAQRRRPALIISDIVMPEMDGYTLCKKIKSDRKLRDVPVILLTSLSSPLDIIRGLESGADNFIPKPYEKDDLLSRIQHILANAELRKGQKTQLGLEIIFSNEKYLITSERQQILDLLLSTYETAVRKNLELMQSQNELNQLNEQLDQKVRELQVTTSFLNNILESSTEYSIIATDLEGTILTWNEGARRNYGYLAEEMVGKTKIQILHTAQDVKSGEVDKFLEAAFKLGQADGVFEHVRRSGERFPASASVTLRRDVNGAAIGYLLISKDITHQQALEEQLRKKNEELEQQNVRVQEANRLKSEFLANMSHELRTPLNGIIGFAELMHDGKVGPVSAQHQEYLGDILISAKHLLQLINDVLDLSKVEAGKMEFKPEPVAPELLVREVSDIVRTLAAHKRIKLAAEIDDTLTNIVADPRSLKQILYNYLSNALKFTPDEGKIVVRMRTENQDQFRIEVEDSGIGIKAEDIDRLFVEFQQLDSSSAKKYSGTGLGLALTKKIVEAQGGRVGVESMPGRGSIFYAILPKVSYGIGEIKEDHEPATTALGAPLVLVVEDEIKDRAWLIRELSQAGYSVESVATGAEALVRCREKRYDAIMLDMMLPDMSGRAVLGKIRERGLNLETPVVVVTVLAHKGMGVGYEVGDILAKPVSQDEILKALKRCGVEPSSRQPILVVDDDESILKLADKTLSELGYRPVCRQDATSALQAASKEPPAAVVLDLVMPHINGFEFLRRFRNSQPGQRTPVIVWTSKDLTEAERSYLQSAADSVVTKSDRTDELLRELKDCFRENPTAREKQPGQ